MSLVLCGLDITRTEIQIRIRRYLKLVKYVNIFLYVKRYLDTMRWLFKFLDRFGYHAPVLPV